MNRTIKIYSTWFLFGIFIGITAIAFTISILAHTTIRVSAHPADAFGPACGSATVDGNINPQEWASAASQTFLMEAPNIGEPFTATLYVMNSGYYLYIGVTINDDELSTYGEYLQQGDEAYFVFDNDHSGSIYTLNNDALGVYAGPPQFDDLFILGNPNPFTSASDRDYNGTLDGLGRPTRVGNLNHFELRHPLCSGDERDFCLHAGDTVGFQLEYLDAQANGDFGGTQFYPGNGDTEIADIVIGNCSAADLFTYLPFLQK